MRFFLRSIFVCTVFVTTAAHSQEAAAVPEQNQVEDLEAKQKELLRKEQELLKSLSKDQGKQASKKPPTSEKKQPTVVPTAKPTVAAPVATKIPEPTKPPAPTCDDQLTKSNEVITRLRKELDETRSRLAISETEVERLAYLLDDKSGNKKAGAALARKPAQNEGLRVREPGEIQPKVDQDMSIATVVAEKAQLRTGPGMNNSPLMTVAKGTRLAIETRSGQWYRVIAPSGARAWVSAEVIDFGSGAQIKNEPSFARNPGLNDTTIDPAEAAAFDAIIKGSKKP